MSFLLQTSKDPMSLIPEARSRVLAVDKNQPIREVKTLGQLFVDEASPFRFAAVLMLILGAIALTLSAIGVYGVMSYSISQRSHEIGIRNALGAQRGDVLRLILSQGLRTTLIGSLIGLILALALSRLMANQLFGIVNFDLSVLAGFALLLIAVSLVSCFIPANYASKMDPMMALRYE
jgi:putative ABC transport system permease protein